MLLIKSKPVRTLCGALETLNLLTLRLWWKNPGRVKPFAGKVFRDYMSLVECDKWVCRELHEIFPEWSDNRIVLEHMRGAGIVTPVDELAYLALITKNLRPMRIFEIGTFRGRTALNFALNAPPECIVYTLDLPMDVRESYGQQTNASDAAIIAGSETGIDYRGKDVASKIRQLYGDSASMDFSSYYAKMDLVFVDGAHHYAAVVSDTQNALKMVADGGVILWHDFANYGDYNDVTRAVVELLPRGEVIQIGATQLALYRKPPHTPLSQIES